MVLSCYVVKGVAPEGDVQISLGAQKSDTLHVVCLFDVASPVSYGEKTDSPRACSFIPILFLPRTCTWSAVIGGTP